MSSNALDSPPSPTLRWLMLVVLYAIPLVVTIRPVADPVYDPDIWWHLRVGQWVVEHQSVTSSDPFAQPGAPWVAYSWLFEVGIYGLYQWLGLAGVIVYRVLLSLCIVASLHALVARFEKRFLVAMIILGPAVLAVAMLFGERPWLITVLIATLTLHAVLCFRQPEPLPSWVWGLPLGYALWANIHIQFVYGLFLLTLGCVVPLLDRHFHLRDVDESAAWPLTRRWWLLLGLSLACLLATLATPYHLHLYRVVLEYATQPGPFRWVNELKALEFREPSDWVLLAMTLAAYYLLGRRTFSLFELFLLSSAAFFAFRARRDLWFLLLANLTVLSTTASKPASEEERYAPSWGGTFALVLILAMIGVVRTLTQDLSPKGLQTAIARRFPVEAVDYIRANRLPGPLFNDFNWGGYLIWALPDLPVVVDGRTNLHGDARIERIGAVWAGMPGWDDDPDLKRARVIVAPSESPLISLLRLDTRNYREVHRDQTACVFIPTTDTR